MNTRALGDNVVAMTAVFVRPSDTIGGVGLLIWRVWKSDELDGQRPLAVNPRRRKQQLAESG